MRDVEFLENNYNDTNMRKTLRDLRVPKMIRFLQKNHIVKTENQGYMVLISLVLVCLIITGIVITSLLAPPKPGQLLISPDAPAPFQNLANKSKNIQ